MLLSSHKIAQTQAHALNNLHGVSAACLDAGQRMSELLAAGSRARLKRSHQHLAQIAAGNFDPLAETLRGLEQDGADASPFIEQFLEILGSAHKALIAASAAQVRVFDEIVFASLTRVSNFSPRQTEVVFDAMRSTLEGAERSLNEMSDVAIQTLDLAEQEIHQLSDSLAEKNKTTRKSPTKSRKKAEE